MSRIVLMDLVFVVFIFWTGFILIKPSVTLAVEKTLVMDDLKVAKMARDKNYPGGRDEEDLEVQAQVLKPVRKEETKKGSVETPVSNDDEF